jgi:hypothetical protein
MIASAANIEYHLEKEWVKIWINSDGTIDLQYSIEITCDKGEIRYIDIDQPTGDFTIGYAYDSLDRSLKVEDASEGSDYEVRVYLSEKLKTGETAFFTVTTNVGYMIWKDEQNPGNVGMQFIPCTWNAEVKDLRVIVLLPQGVDKSEVRNTPDWDNIYVDTEEDRLAIYWERLDLAPNEAFTVGVSFPERYVEKYETEKNGILENISKFLFFIPFIAIFLIVIGGIIYSVRKRPYLTPQVKMESLGIKRGLTAVEAAHLLDLKPERTVTMILYSLLKKRAIWIKESKPTVKLDIMDDYKDLAGDKATPLRYYEKDFLKSVTKNGTLDEKELARTYMNLRNAVENKLRGYCREDTISYYKKTVKKAWEQVKSAGTSDIASKAYDEHLLWLLLDENYQQHTGDVFQNKDFAPAPLWWWFWYIYSHHHPHPTYTPRKDQTSTRTPPKIPGSEFADNIATALEKTAGNIVTNLEKFADSILPAPTPPRTSRDPAHHKSSCVCACHACACACACVSCACACAGGGGVG